MQKSKINFYVNEDKGLVVATQDIYQVYQTNLPKPITFKAKAKCNLTKGDTFDLTIGKQLALLRLKTKIAKFHKGFFEKLQEKADKLVDNYNNIYEERFCEMNSFESKLR